MSAVLADPAAVDKEKADAFAIVGGEAVSMRTFEDSVALGVRQRFYHGNPNADQLARYRREVAESLIERVLLLQEARRRGIAPDAKAVQARLTAYTEKMEAHGRDAAERERTVSALRRALEEESVLTRIEAKIKTVAEPGPEEAEEYYRAHPDQFTTPEALRVSLILLKVEPASPAAVWEAAREEAAKLVARLREGGDFAELARIHSGDGSAKEGGDLGFVHGGMLAPAAQAAVDALAPGQVSEPVALLQGVALFRLLDRVPARLNEYAAVASRARELLLRERRERAWKDFVEGLRRGTPVTVRAGL